MLFGEQVRCEAGGHVHSVHRKGVRLLVLLTGLPGSGKSTVARTIGAALGNCSVLTTELIRSTLFELTAQPGDSDFTPSELGIVYRSLQYTAETLLAQNCDVIADGVYRSPDQRDAMERLAIQAAAPFIGLFVSCPYDVAMGRLRERSARSSHSPGGVETYREIEKGFALPPSSYLKVDTSSLVLNSQGLVNLPSTLLAMIVRNPQ